MNSTRPNMVNNMNTLGAGVDINTLPPQDQRLLRLYGGRFPSQSHLFAKKHLHKERKYFDSGDYALSKAGRGVDPLSGGIGSLHPVPQNIPHPHLHLRTTSSSSSTSSSPASSPAGSPSDRSKYM
ncbi:hypothetical protein B0H66DRAFT_539267 [Apodospora peruviana]|uniref:mRNA stability protein n=1 Tax=Apodospora peruviana TaxID=516989 RepID=A0AAE0IPH1_9PEZI|nr:hypothetical protein B0H66DRAFT_539267 [Apodospora peruviana]